MVRVDVVGGGAYDTLRIHPTIEGSIMFWKSQAVLLLACAKHYIDNPLRFSHKGLLSVVGGC